MVDRARAASRWKTWSGRVLFLGAVLALLGTSKPKGWSLDGKISGPKSAPAEHGLKLTIEASDEPFVSAAGVPKGYTVMTPFLAPFRLGQKAEYLLPPGATLSAVQLLGGCRGCSGECAPPSGAHLEVTTEIVSEWIATGTNGIATSLPHDQQSTLSRIEVIVSGAEFASVKLTVRRKGDEVTLFTDEQSCHLDAMRPNREDLRGHCFFFVDNALVRPKTDVTVSAEGTGYGACPRNAILCDSPKTFKVDSVGFMQ